MASERDRERAVKQAEKDEAARFADWKKIQEDAGHTVTGTTMREAQVAELPSGPTYNDGDGNPDG